MEHPAFKISSVLLRDLYCHESQYYKEIETVVLKREKKKSHLPSKSKKDFLKKMPSREREWKDWLQCGRDQNSVLGVLFCQNGLNWSGDSYDRMPVMRQAQS